MNLPNALVIGPMRSATTWVYEYLKSREDVCLPSNGVKETFFYDRNFTKGLSWYADHFSEFNSSKHLKIVEVGPSYFHYAEAPVTIHETLGTPTLIMVVRDPVARSISHYRHIRRLGLFSGSLKEAVGAFPEIIEASLYFKQLRRWEDIFGNGKVCILHQDYLTGNPERFVSELCVHLNIPYVDIPASLRESEVNSAGDPPSFLLAKIGTNFTDWLRERKLYQVIQVAKALGLKKLFYGSGKYSNSSSANAPSITPDEKKILEEIINPDWHNFKNILFERQQQSGTDRTEDL